MSEDKKYEEFFIGENEDEIENEKKKKRELMSYFPKMLGNVDETNYLLRDSDKTDWNGYKQYKSNVSKEPKPNIPTKSLVNFGNKKNAFNFGVKEDKSDNSIRNKSNSPYAVNNNTLNITTITNNGPSNTKKSDKTDISEVFGKQDNLTFSDDCFKPNNKHAGSENDEVWDKNVAIDFSMQGLNKKENLSCGVDSLMQNNDNSKSNNLSYEKQISYLKSQIPAGVLYILDKTGAKIEIDEKLQTPGQYNSKDNTIRLQTATNIDTFLGETIHVVQNYLGMNKTGHSNLEFQEHVLRELYNVVNTGLRSYIYVSEDKQNDVSDFYEQVVNDGVVDLKRFTKGINYFFDDFQRRYSKTPGYIRHVVDNYDYKWDMFFDILGIRYE